MTTSAIPLSELDAADTVKIKTTIDWPATLPRVFSTGPFSRHLAPASHSFFAIAADAITVRESRRFQGDRHTQKLLAIETTNQGE